MIIVECNPDEYIVKSLGFHRNSIKHGGGKGNVLNIVKKGHNIVGIIDEDPYNNQPSELRKYKNYKGYKRDTIRLMKRKGNDLRWLIIISEYLEDWLIKRSRINKMSLKEYNLPDDPKELHKIIKIEQNKNFQRFIQDLFNKDEEVRTLKEWIQKLS